MKIIAIALLSFSLAACSDSDRDYPGFRKGDKVQLGGRTLRFIEEGKETVILEDPATGDQSAIKKSRITSLTKVKD